VDVVPANPGPICDQGNEEVDVLLHLPIANLAALSPIAVSSSVPQFDIAGECRDEGSSTAIFERCSQGETAALAQLTTEWAQFAGTDQKTCIVTTTTGGFASYVELLSCLEMARDVLSANANPEDPRAKSGSRPMRPDLTDVIVGEAHRH
jgi:hypothetical protein